MNAHPTRTPDAGALALSTSGDWSARASVLDAWDALPIATPRPAGIVRPDARLTAEYRATLARMRGYTTGGRASA